MRSRHVASPIASKLTSVVAFVLFAVLCAAPARAPAAPTPEDPPAAGGGGAAAAAAAVNRFSFGLWKELRATSDGNLVLSPASVAIALGMTTAGARGDTAAELLDVLQLTASADPHSDLADLLLGLRARHGRAGLKLRLANQLFGQRGLSFRSEFLDLLRRRYEAPLEVLDFGGAEEARARINGWVSKQTERRLPELLKAGTIGPEVRLVLVNAIWFKGAWEHRFDPKNTRPGTFHAADGPVEVPLMRRSAELPFAETDGVQVVELPYRGGLSMVLVLPAERDGLEAVEARLGSAYGGWLAALRDTTVDLVLPRFRAESGFELGPALAALGARLAFSDGADFGGMVEGGGLRIDRVAHGAFIEVNEEGAEAAAATAVVAVPVSMPRVRRFTADHPFLFFIRDPASGVVLFLGRVAKPQDA